MFLVLIILVIAYRAFVVCLSLTLFASEPVEVSLVGSVLFQLLLLVPIHTPRILLQVSELLLRIGIWVLVGAREEGEVVVGRGFCPILQIARFF